MHSLKRRRTGRPAPFKRFDLDCGARLMMFARTKISRTFFPLARSPRGQRGRAAERGRGYSAKTDCRKSPLEWRRKDPRRWGRERGRVRIARGGANLALQFAIARRIDRRKRGAGRCQGLRIRHASGGTKNAQELVALAADASEHAKLLENHGPGNDREQKQKQKNAAGDPASLREDISDIGYKNRGEQKNDALLSESK